MNWKTNKKVVSKNEYWVTVRKFGFYEKTLFYRSFRIFSDIRGRHMSGRFRVKMKVSKVRK